MAVLLTLNIRDVTQLPEERPAPDPDASPERTFAIAHGAVGFSLDFDGRKASVPDQEIRALLSRVGEGTSVEWRHSRDPEIQTTFRPLNRILQCLNSTPAYQLFLAGFHIGDSIGLFDLGQVQEPAISDSFRYLVGNLPWAGGKKGRLFFLPDDYIAPDVERELVANSKLVSADFFIGQDDPTSHVARKLFVPYATPIGFNTRVQKETEEAWRRISDLVRRQGGGQVL
jgi:hypothetical protein